MSDAEKSSTAGANGGEDAAMRGPAPSLLSFSGLRVEHGSGVKRA
jgi:hypothetical protein